MPGMMEVFGGIPPHTTIITAACSISEIDRRVGEHAHHVYL